MGVSHKFRQSFLHPDAMGGSINHEVWADISKAKVYSKVNKNQLDSYEGVNTLCENSSKKACV